MTTSKIVMLYVLLISGLSHGAELRRFETSGRIITSKKIIGASFAPHLAWTPYFQLNPNWVFDLSVGVSAHSSETGSFTSYQTVAGLKYTGWQRWSPEIMVGNEMWHRVQNYNGFTYAANLHYHPGFDFNLIDKANLKLDSAFVGYSGLNIEGNDYQQGLIGFRFTFGHDSVEVADVASPKKSSKPVPEPKVSQGSGSHETVVAEINFDQNQWGLSQAMVNDLDSVVEKLKANTKSQIKIQGHTNHYGSDRQNIRISELRAQNVKYHLVKKGIAKERILIEALGSSMPAVTGNSQEAKKRNRRALILVVE